MLVCFYFSEMRQRKLNVAMICLWLGRFCIDYYYNHATFPCLSQAFFQTGFDFLSRLFLKKSFDRTAFGLFTSSRPFRVILRVQLREAFLWNSTTCHSFQAHHWYQKVDNRFGIQSSLVSGNPKELSKWKTAQTWWRRWSWPPWWQTLPWHVPWKNRFAHWLTIAQRLSFLQIH